MTKDELIVLATAEVMDLSEELDATDYSNACDDASRETGFTFPVTGDLKVYWLKERTKRHLLWYLVHGGAKKFRVKSYHLDQKFKHYMELIKFSDDAFKEIQDARPDLFAGVDPSAMFGTRIAAGFSYDAVGRNTTYESDNYVEQSPDPSE